SVWKNLLRSELSLSIDGYRMAGYPNRIVCRYAATLYLHGTAAKRNPATREVAYAVGSQQLSRWRSIGLLSLSGIGAIQRFMVQPKRLRTGLVKIPLRVVGAKQKL